MKEIHGYFRQDGGTLTPTTLLLDGEQVMTVRGWPLEPTGRTERLVNWGESSGDRPIFVNDGGREYVVVMP